MDNADKIMEKLLDLDIEAEHIRLQAHEESSRILNQTKERIKEEQKENAQNNEKRIAQIREVAKTKRTQELSKIQHEFDTHVESVKNIPSEIIDHAQQLILSKVKGNTA